MAKDTIKTPRFGWALTGSGHFVKESLAIIKRLPDLDLFLSSAAEEVLKMYKQDLVLPEGARVYRDRTASAAPVGNFYYGVYHTLILGPGGFRFGDYWRLGLPLEILVVAVSLPTLLWVWPL